MYLDEIVLEGFKSYAEQTTVGPFDPTFNAISGFNGSGKSNILDAICFVMGIKSLAQMRVTKVDELIYKQGHGGISKASVTLIFRNSDRKTSPFGYASHTKISITRQIAVGGRDHFMINGHTAKASTVQTLFQSVQLNVNTAHFLVMQGRVQKIVNLKPLELSSLIEEASGTKFYEAKRSESKRKIDQKQAKLQEVEEIINGEIMPSLRTLRQHQAEQVKLLRISKDLEQLNRLCSVVQLHRRGQILRQLKTELQTADRAVRNLQNEKADLEQKLTETIDRAEHSKQQCQAEKGAIDQLAAAAQKCRSEVSVRKVECAEAERRLHELQNSRLKAEQKLAKLNAEAAAQAAVFEKEKTEELYLQQQVESLRETVSMLLASQEELRTGATLTVDVNKGSAKQRLAAAQAKLQALKLRAAELRITVDHLHKELTSTSASAKDAAEHVRQLRIDEKNVKARLEEIQVAVNNLKSVPQELERVQGRKKEFEGVYAQLSEKRSNLEARTRAITRFHEEVPQAGLQKDVRGLAIELLRLKPEFQMFWLALEEAGKNRLLSIVVKDDDVAKQVLERYSTIRRVSCIPMNRIKGKALTEDQIAFAQQTLRAKSKEVIRPTDAIVLADNEYCESINYVFGQAYLCASQELAQAVCSNRSIKGMAVTLEGDSFNPHGSVTGGSTAGLSGLLRDFDELLRVLETERESVLQLKEVQQEFNELLKKRELLVANETEASKLEISLEGICNKIKQSHAADPSNTLRNDYDTALQELERIEGVEIPFLQSEEVPRWTAQVADLDCPPEDAVKMLTKKLVTAKQHLKEAEKAYKKICTANESFNAQVAVLHDQSEKLKEVIAALDANDQIPAAVNALEQAHQILKAAEAAAVAAEARAETASSEMNKRFANVWRNSEQEVFLREQIAGLEAELQRQTHAVRSGRQRMQEEDRIRINMLRAEPWLNDVEKTGFEGYENLDSPDVMDCFSKRERIIAESQALSRNVSKDVAQLLQGAETQLQVLLEKRDRIVKDREHLEKFIEELDDKRREVMIHCFKKVDENLSAIFSILLPSSDARIVPLDLKTGSLELGLELRVKISSTAKEASLGELSGGQRSLLALSLILALLKYKAAPMYILDEVDAALDPSHTQRIGKMIKQQFRGSQFIIISLKENLYNYADVLFKTSFSGGSSRVQRIANGGGTNPDLDADDNDENLHHNSTALATTGFASRRRKVRAV